MLRNKEICLEAVEVMQGREAIGLDRELDLRW